MRNITTAALAALLVLSLAAAAIGADRIAYVNSDRIRLEYDGARDIQSQLEASVEDWRSEARTMEAEIQAAIVELQSQQLLLSEEAKREKEQSIQEKQVAYEAFLNDVWGVGGLAARREAELWQPAFDRINAVLKEIGEEGDYTMIFDAAQMGIVFAAPDTDLSQQVIDRVNGELE